ncbi:alpha/beta fold hydrolase [Methylobacterium soli]|uniref:Alpha/beta fold hydrolase n=2 Tax=Methylobacterium soli TaxID=553447 RepID=A0A6L3T0X9_9HYPH|nr:alpha/beta fold hydrolase [Methylobacterium soli]KAB1080131.1 alpha/beta fold hydrolase [Methylobacterium soli]
MKVSRISTRVIEANGLRFAVDEAGAGPDIALCLHGFPESRFSWRHQLPALADLGWHAVAPDMRGYGDSARPQGRAAYRMEHLVADAEGLFDALGARRRLLVGHDWGALVAWSFAIERRRLDGLVVMNVPHPEVFRRVLRRSWRQRLRSLYVAFFQIPRLPEWALTRDGAVAVGRAFTRMAVDKSAFPESVLAHYRENALKPGAMTAMLAYYRANLRGLLAARAMPVIEVPVLMVWGEADTALGVELTEGYDALVRDFTLRRLPGISHWVQQEAPEAVNAILGEWLPARGLTPGAP